ncbi:MAG TPA: hypothetical protein VJZ91_12910 [Blastocatellia bacterium]|nr:hypothetical protein [Blastocatellia bacterium]
MRIRTSRALASTDHPDGLKKQYDALLQAAKAEGMTINTWLYERLLIRAGLSARSQRRAG